ncbi:hypothetical protein D3C81_2024120 [compost metagenome]
MTFSAGPMPAQLTSPCSAPKVSTAVCTALIASASLVTSVRTKRALASPSSATRAAPASALMSAITTLPPASTSVFAVAAPRPEPPPVTMNTLFSIRTVALSRMY